MRAVREAMRPVYEQMGIVPVKQRAVDVEPTIAG
jgi:hypothetical protein